MARCITSSRTKYNATNYHFSRAVRLRVWICAATVVKLIVELSVYEIESLQRLRTKRARGYVRRGLQGDRRCDLLLDRTHVVRNYDYYRRIIRYVNC